MLRRYSHHFCNLDINHYHFPTSTEMVDSCARKSSRCRTVVPQMLFFLRFVQLGTITIAGFIYCWLVWHHNNHYCAYHPRLCTREELRNVPVLWEYYLVIGAVR
jgi:hypothetical protein